MQRLKGNGILGVEWGEKAKSLFTVSKAKNDLNYRAKNYFAKDDDFN